MTVTDRPLEGIDLLAATWGKGVPHDQFDRLRAEAPVYFHPEPDDTGLLGDHQARRRADGQPRPRDVLVELGGTFIPTADEEALASLRLTILNMDPPKHRRYRRLVSKGFTPRMIAKLVEDIERRAVKRHRRRHREGRGASSSRRSPPRSPSR